MSTKRTSFLIIHLKINCGDQSAASGHFQTGTCWMIRFRESRYPNFSFESRLQIYFWPSYILLVLDDILSQVSNWTSPISK